MNRIEHTGTVIETDGERAVVEFEAGQACGTMRACACCGGAQGGPRRVVVRQEGLSVGERVELSIPGYRGYLSTLLVFVLPMAGFIAGMIVGAQFEPTPAHDVATLIGGVIGLGAAVCVAVAANRLLTRLGGDIEVRRPGAR